METGLKFILSSFLLCVITTLLIAINFIYKDFFKVEYNKNPEIKNVEVFEEEFEYNGIIEKINVANYKSHLGFQMNYEVDKFKPSLKSDSSVYFYYKDNVDIYLKVEKLNRRDYYDSYNKDNSQKDNNDSIYQYDYLRSDKSYFKITSKNLDNQDYSYLNSRFEYMINSFYILD